MTPEEFLTERRRIHEAAEGPWEWEPEIVSQAKFRPAKVSSVGCTAYPINHAVATTAPATTAIVDAHDSLPLMVTALEKVLELHAPTHDFCHECDRTAPCDTRLAITAALGDGEGDRTRHLRHVLEDRTPAPAEMPKPTNEEKWSARWWVEHASADVYDCEACGEANDLCPVHHGVSLGMEYMARKIRSLGDDPELLDRIPDPEDRTECIRGGT